MRSREGRETENPKQNSKNCSMGTNSINLKQRGNNGKAVPIDFVSQNAFGFRIPRKKATPNASLNIPRPEFTVSISL